MAQDLLASKTLEPLSSEKVSENLRLIEDLKFFLATAPANWQKNQIIRRYYLNHDEGFVSCVFWNNLYFVTGTDIVRCIVYRFELFGREIIDRKKFEEGIFSDLRSLKCGTNAVLEDSKSPFLNFLYKNQCLRTQKKQKVFFWYSVPHDRLFADALERDLKKELQGSTGTTKSKYEPSLSFKFNENETLNDQLTAYVEDQRKKNDEFESLLTNSEDDEFSQDIVEPQKSTIKKEPSTFIIKEQNQTPVVEKSNFDDDFPLDYFPPNDDNDLVDPEVFFNPPTDNFDASFLIDQTYTKTPFKDVTFGDKVNRTPVKQEEFENDMNYLPPSSNPYHLQPLSSRNSHFYNQPYVPSQQLYPQITNAQYYDSQISGEPLDLANYPSDDYIQQATPAQLDFPPPAFYGNIVHNSQGVPMFNPGVNDPYAAQIAEPQYMYPQYGYQWEFDEGDDDLYNAFERPPFQQQYQQQQFPFQLQQQQPVPGMSYLHSAVHLPMSAGGNGMRLVSPFGMVFPSYEAMNPPKSTKRAKFASGRTPGRVVKNSTNAAASTVARKLKNSPAVSSKLNNSIKKGTVRIVEPGAESKEQGQVKIEQNDDDDDDDNNTEDERNPGDENDDYNDDNMKDTKNDEEKTKTSDSD
jgi:hypothetical protein